MAVQKKVDVVTIGAGWTSGILGGKLGSAGHKVVALEAGPVRVRQIEISNIIMMRSSTKCIKP